MAFHVRDQETDALVRELALKRGIGLTEAIRVAVQNELRRVEWETPKLQRMRALQEEVAKWPDSGLKADKAFYDWLSGDED